MVSEEDQEGGVDFELWCGWCVGLEWIYYIYVVLDFVGSFYPIRKGSETHYS